MIGPAVGFILLVQMKDRQLSFLVAVSKVLPLIQVILLHGLAGYFLFKDGFDYSWLLPIGT